MPTGPSGEWRPADVVGHSVAVAHIATDEIEDAGFKHLAKCAAGLAGASAGTESIGTRKRKQIARVVAKARSAVSGKVQ